MAWGGCSAQEKTDVDFIDTQMNSASYVNASKDQLGKHAKLSCGQNYSLQQDNAAIHAPKLTYS